MQTPNPMPTDNAHELCAWFGYWAQFVILAVFVVLGAFYGAQGTEPGDETAGIVLVVAATLVAFMRLKAGFDGGDRGWGSFLFVDDMANLPLAVVVLTILGLVGLFVAATHDAGGLHDGGVALVLVAAWFVVMNIKRVFDTAETHH
jgi:hypothetical protein